MSARVVVFVTPSLNENSLGRTYSLALLCEYLGIDYSVVSLGKCAPMWPPLANTEFAARCVAVDLRDDDRRAAVIEQLRAADVIVAVKAMPESLGSTLDLGVDLTKLIVDVDDPDVEAQTVWRTPARRLNAMRRRRYWQLRRCGRIARTFPTMASNPILQQMYGAALIPHARHVLPDAELRTDSSTTRVAFVGTPKPHKGIGVLREAIRQLAPEGFVLDITAEPPPDARPNESWVGTTSLEQGMALLRAADVVAVPSLDRSYARAQLPVKIVDALLSGRPVVASRVGPLPWAVGEGGILVPAGSVADLVDALRRLADPSLRVRLGALGRAHAITTYSVESVAPAFAAVLARA